MTSPLRLVVTGRQTRIQFGAKESVHRRTTRPMASLAEAIATLIRIAATVLPRLRSNPGSVSATTSPRSAAGVIIGGYQPQSRLAAAPRHLREQPGGGLTEGKHRLVLCPVHIRSLAEGTVHGRRKNSDNGA